jgi:hypothetical protein
MRTSFLLMWVLWPSFLAACLGSGVVFALVDPLEVPIMGHYMSNREGMYAALFFLMWLLASLSSAASAFLIIAGERQAGKKEIDKSPF